MRAIEAAHHLRTLLVLGVDLERGHFAERPLVSAGFRQHLSTRRLVTVEHPVERHVVRIADNATLGVKFD